MKKFKYSAIIFALAFMLNTSVAHAQSVDTDSLIERLRVLVQQMLELRAEMNEVSTEIKEEIRVGLREGMTDEDIKKVQEILATDKSIYPEGLVTGYFGPLTKNALKRFQEKFEIEVTGELDEDTRAYLEELLTERFGDKIPPGLLIAPGIRKKVELRLLEGCDNSGPGKAPFCKELRIKIEGDEDEDDNEDEEVSEAEATSAIDDAKDAIADLETAIEDADEDDEGYEEAGDQLEEANELLEEAVTAFDDEDYEEAFDKAEEVKEAAEDGLDELEATDV